jgi:predicted ATP-grasp superfamily ATP-dependent carboligase
VKSGTAIVLCAGFTGLGAVRALSRRGVRVVAVYSEEGSPVHSSSVPHRKHRLADDSDDDALISLLALYADDRAVVLSCSDAGADFLSRQRDRLLSLGLYPAGPTGQLSELLNDKATELARMQGMPVTLPRSLVRLPGDIDELLKSLSLPIIIKPRSYRHVQLIRAKNFIAANRAALEGFMREQRDNLDAFVAQEIVPGPDEMLWVCNCCFGNDGTLLSAFTFQRIRTSPPHFGVTSFAVGRNNRVVKRQCAMIGKALGYSGPAMMEFKYDVGRDVYCYIETNPRIGMCNVLDEMSGVDNVYVACQVARGTEPEARADHQIDGVVFISAYDDLYSRYKNGESFRSIVRAYWETRHAPHAWAYYDPRDPIPFVHATWESAREITGALGRKAAAVLLGR